MKNSYTLFVFFFLFLGCDSPKKQTIASQKADSLAYFFEKANNDTVPYAKRQFYTKKAIAIISKDKNDSMNRVNYFKVANRYFNMGDWENYKKTVDLIVKKAEKVDDKKSLAKAYSYLGDYYGYKKINDSIYKFTDKAEKLYSKENDHINVAKALLSKAILKHEKSDFLGCESDIFKVLERLRVDQDNELLYEAYNLLGIVYSELEEYKLSREYYTKALETINKVEHSPKNFLRAITFNNLGLSYRNQNKHKEAIKQFHLALKEGNLRKERPYIFATLKDNLAYSKLKSGNNDSLPNMFFEALKIKDSLNVVAGIITNRIHLSEYYAFKTDTLKAIQYAQEGYVLAKNNNLEEDVLFSLEQLVDIDPKHASEYSKEHFRINDSIQIAEMKVRNKFARIEYETEELALEKNKLVEQKSLLIYIAIGIFLVAIVVFIIRYQLSKAKELRLLQQQQKANEEIYNLMIEQQQKIEEGRQLEKKRISRELHDGVMGGLSSIRLNLFILSKKTDPETIAKCLEHIGEIQNIEKEIKTIAYDLEKNVFSDTIGFVTIVKNLFKEIEEHSNLSFHLDVDETIEWETLQGNTKINLYRVLQESLHNITKYAMAKKVTLSIHQTGNAIALAIEDDGIGFDVQQIKKGLGLKNMEERTKEMNGKINISSEEGRGTKINLIIPV